MHTGYLLSSPRYVFNYMEVVTYQFHSKHVPRQHTYLEALTQPYCDMHGHSPCTHIPMAHTRWTAMQKATWHSHQMP